MPQRAEHRLAIVVLPHQAMLPTELSTLCVGTPTALKARSMEATNRWTTCSPCLRPTQFVHILGVHRRLE